MNLGKFNSALSNFLITRFFVLSMVYLLTMFFVPDCFSARIKDIASIRGVRENQLVGYGLVVGLKGTGDSKSEFTSKSFTRMLNNLGLKLENQVNASKNAAAVIVTATLPPFAKAGNVLDVTVSAIGDATSLEGGTLLMTPLRAANEQVFAIAQGPVSLGGGGKEVFPTVGRVVGGATIERDISVDFSTRKVFRLTLHNPDFLTAARMTKSINKVLGGQYASAKDAATVDLVVPYNFEGKGVELLAIVESIDVAPDQKARLVINEKTGTVVMGENVRISPVAIAHGSLTVKIGDGDSKIGGRQDGRVHLLEGSSSVKDLVAVLNKLGVSPKDLIAILQAIKAAGALHGELDFL